MHAEFTPRNVIKYVAKTLVATKTAQITEDAITNYTRFDDDDKIVTIGSGLVGWYVSDKLKPYTDTMVDKAADWIVARKEKKQSEKTAE